MTGTKSRSMDRRRFLQGTLAASAPLFIPASVLGREGRTPPSERVVLGCIGVGSQGTSNMKSFLKEERVQVVAVCDVDRKHMARARRRVDKAYGERTRGGGCAEYPHHEELLARTDIDAVSLATPDHWHAHTAILAARAGKDIYAEKPLALTIAEGRAMSDTVRRTGRIWQTGSWQRSVTKFRHACELVRNGYIGELQAVEVGLPTGPKGGSLKPIAVPEWLDYDRWLGPAPAAAYTKDRTHWDFRWILDYSGGQVTDWGAHHCDIAQWGMGTEYTGPVEVEGEGVFPTEGLWDAATDYIFRCRYKSGLVLSVTNADYRGKKKDEEWPLAERHGKPNRRGVWFKGSKGTVHVNRSRIVTEPASLQRQPIGPTEKRLYRSPGHIANFLDCIRTRAETITPIEVAHRSITIAHLGNIAMRLGRKIRWDPDREIIVGDDQAARLLTRPMRSPYQV